MAMLLVFPLGMRRALAQDDVEIGDAWVNGYTLFLTSAENIDQAYEAADAIKRAGGGVGVIIPNQVMLGWLPADKINGLVGKSNIQQIHQKPLARSTALSVLTAGSMQDESVLNAIEFFNDVAGGTFKMKKDAVKAQVEASGIKPQMLPDVFESPPISESDYMANLAAHGISEADLQKAGVYLNRVAPGAVAPSPGNSDYMAGKVYFTAMFVQSDGKIDKQLYTWSSADRQTIQGEIVSGLSWWANTAQSSKYDVPLTFVYNYQYGANTKTSYEPITHPSSDDGLWISQIMANYGYSSGDKMARCTAFNTAQRQANKTNWAVVSFIAYNPSPAPTTFTDGYFSYAYIRGPYSQLCFSNDGWGVSRYYLVNTHETGHLFGAEDEYYQKGYGGCGANDCTTFFTNHVYNGNCAQCNSNQVKCVYVDDSQNLCGYTPGLIGWTGIQSPSLTTANTSGTSKSFFAPGETIQYRLHYCVAGPKVGSNKLSVRSHVSVNYFGGSPGSSTTVTQNGSWMSSGTVSPPTSTGVACYVTWVDWSIPSNVIQGPAEAAMQIEVVGMGKGAASTTNSMNFYVADGAINSQPSPLAPYVPEDVSPTSAGTAPAN
jgi:hypothetical protein